MTLLKLKEKMWDPKADFRLDRGDLELAKAQWGVDKVVVFQKRSGMGMEIDQDVMNYIRPEFRHSFPSLETFVSALEKDYLSVGAIHDNSERLARALTKWTVNTWKALPVDR